MRKHLRHIGVGSALLLAGLAWFAVADAGPAATDQPAVALIDKPVLPEPDLTSLTENDIKIIQTALAGGMPDKKSQTRAKASAYMVALYAQTLNEGGKSGSLATLRDAALKVAEEVNKENFTAAADIAKTLSPKMPADPNAKTAPMPLQTMLEIGDLMSQFKVARSGGQDLEKQMNDFIKKPTSSLDLKAAGLLANKVATISQYTEAMPPMAAGGKDPKKWVQWSQDMRVSALEASKAAKAGKAKDTKDALRKMEVSCTSCHNLFRDAG
jgi:hypothetical protein